MTFPGNSSEFFWLSDRDGFQHLYRYDYSGKLINQVTQGNWSVTRVEGSDAPQQTIYYTSTEASPLQRQLYSVRFDGSNEKRITTVSGNHRINMSPTATYFIDRYSRIVNELEVAYSEARDAGDLRAGIDPTRAARDLVALMDGLQIQWLLGDPSLNMAAAVEAHLRAQLVEPRS